MERINNRYKRDMTAVNWLEEAITENLKEIITKCNVELMELLFIQAKGIEQENLEKLKDFDTWKEWKNS